MRSGRTVPGISPQFIGGAVYTAPVPIVQWDTICRASSISMVFKQQGT